MRKDAVPFEQGNRLRAGMESGGAASRSLLADQVLLNDLCGDVASDSGSVRIIDQIASQLCQFTIYGR